jgi:hypothetical protein
MSMKIIRAKMGVPVTTTTSAQQQPHRNAEYQISRQPFHPNRVKPATA